MDKRVRFWKIHRLEVRAVPHDSTAGAQRDIPQQQCFRDGAFELEVRAGLDLATEAGVEPLPIVAGRARQCFRRLREGVHPGLRNQLRVLTVEAAEDRTLVSDEHEPFLVPLPIWFECTRTGRDQLAVLAG